MDITLTLHNFKRGMDLSPRDSCRILAESSSFLNAVRSKMPKPDQCFFWSQVLHHAAPDQTELLGELLPAAGLDKQELLLVLGFLSKEKLFCNPKNIALVFSTLIEAPGELADKEKFIVNWLEHNFYVNQLVNKIGRDFIFFRNLERTDFPLPVLTSCLKVKDKLSQETLLDVAQLCQDLTERSKPELHAAYPSVQTKQELITSSACQTLTGIIPLIKNEAFLTSIFVYASERIEHEVRYLPDPLDAALVEIMPGIRCFINNKIGRRSCLGNPWAPVMRSCIDGMSELTRLEVSSNAVKLLHGQPKAVAIELALSKPIKTVEGLLRLNEIRKQVVSGSVGTPEERILEVIASAGQSSHKTDGHGIDKKNRDRALNYERMLR